MAKDRFRTLLLRCKLSHLAGICVLTLALFHLRAKKLSQSHGNFLKFSELALGFTPITDKLTTHAYGLMYDAYFTEHVAEKPKLKFLEIGLGCDMIYGAGASAQIWKSLFKTGEIWVAEFNTTCAKATWSATSGWKYVTGDQANKTDLYNWIAITGGNFDFIIDDGGHTNRQIWTSFDILFKHALKPGGVYFLEDLHVGRVDPYHAGGVPGSDGAVMMDVIADWTDQLVVASTEYEGGRRSGYAFELHSDIARIDCINNMCAITKQK